MTDDTGRGLAGQLTDVGPATPPPAWCLPDAAPRWEQLTEEDEYGCSTICTWCRDFGDVWVACDDHIVDGRVLRSPPRIQYFEPPRDGIDAATARKLAADLLNAADELEALR